MQSSGNGSVRNRAGTNSFWQRYLPVISVTPRKGADRLAEWAAPLPAVDLEI